MQSFPSALKNVFAGRAGDNLAASHINAKTWPIFRLVPQPRPPAPVTGLREMVESEIIPRLVQAHPTATARDLVAAEPTLPLDAPSAAAFARTILSRNPEALGEFVERVRTRGLGPEILYRDLLAPAAQLLADLWDQDQISFTEVSIGLGRLLHVVRDLDTETAYNGDNDPSARSCLFSPRPGEQQTFGFYMIEEVFRWSGWRTWIETAASTAEMVADVRTQWFDVFCLSVSRLAGMEEVAATIETVRRASRNDELFVLVHGSPFVEHPALVSKVGADGVASSGREALHIAHQAERRLATA